MWEEHCTDCCCAKSWEALGINSYTGRSIPEHITMLRSQLAAATERAEQSEGQLRSAIQSSQQNAINFRHCEVLRIEQQRRAEKAEAVLREIAEKDTYDWGVTARQYFTDKDRQTKPHCHVASYADGVLVDTCGLCGKDLRNPIHSSENKDRQTEGK